MNGTIERTVKDNLCINCGICKFVCKFEAIDMLQNKYGEINPIINKDKCKNCGLCIKYCPNTKDKLISEAKKVSTIEYPHTYGLQDSKYYLAWNSDKAMRQACCSGGAVTKFASYLLNNKIIDGMIHVERVWGKRGDLHYKAKISYTQNEICTHVSSAYQPIDFSEILNLLEKGKSYFITGTPCVIRGIKNLMNNNQNLKDIKIITCALVCSHNTSSRMIDFLTELHNIDDNKPWQVNLRAKDDSIKDANNYKNHIYTKNKDLLNKNRFESGWTKIWRSYYFAMNSCLYCPDFWGYEADISAKDAWGKWSEEDNLGKSIVIIRNKDLEKMFLKSGLNFEELQYDIMKEHQKSTPIYKQTFSKEKFSEPFYSKNNRKSRFFEYYINSHCSKFLYKYFGFKISYILMELISTVTKFMRFI